MKYKVGDKVRVRSDLRVYNTYYMEDRNYHDGFVLGMDEMKGKIVTIRDYCNGKYLIKEYGFYWVDEMFEPCVPFREFLEEVCLK